MIMIAENLRFHKHDKKAEKMQSHSKSLKI